MDRASDNWSSSHRFPSDLGTGTGGLRKLRFAPSSKTGRRGWFRICYAYFPDAGVVLLIVAYAKSELDDIPAEDKKYFSNMIERQKAIFDKGPVR